MINAIAPPIKSRPWSAICWMLGLIVWVAKSVEVETQGQPNLRDAGFVLTIIACNVSPID